ncbi:hypothetical protein FA95DRAFT_861628 [Auriscalpium vulgare]|uniref:Uncharacterized protein n=1 Tax=Auriscalpium vulgare TaxID=40419 RepID=A0ACB8S0Y6_9AGAM|nr:hypothetical protein FA95DRAFT_861628 [Auriscalpium vulgare]
MVLKASKDEPSVQHTPDGMAPPVAFIIGAGSNVGQAVGETLKGLGYKVALGSRSGKTPGDGFLAVKIDITDPKTVAAAFNTVTAELGIPSVVIFNPNSYEHLPKEKDPLSLPYASFQRHVTFGTAVFDAAQHALAGFRKLGPSSAGAPRTFITTGNVSPFWKPSATFVTIQVQKVVSLYLSELFAGSYKKEGFQFYFALQVNEKGGPPVDGEFSGDAHAAAYKRILESASQGEYDVWFLKDGSPYTGPKPGQPTDGELRLVTNNIA